MVGPYGILFFHFSQFQLVAGIPSMKKKHTAIPGLKYIKVGPYGIPQDPD